MREALAVFQAERPGLLAALGLAAQRDWDRQVKQLSESMGDSLGILHYLDDQLTIRGIALAAARHAGNVRAEGMALTSLDIAYQELRRFEEAVDCYQQDIAICRETGDRHGEGQTLNNLGSAYQELRQPAWAVECWREAAAAMRAVGDHNEARRLAELVASTRSQSRRRWWGLRRRSSS
jgi:tetratricopeptide (TPR) repeat protein